MPQKEIEVILARQLASYLSMPMLLTDPDGNLIYYNEPAERIIGRRFEQTGAIAVGEWRQQMEPTEEDGSPCDPDRMPLVVALNERRLVHRSFWINGAGDTRRKIEVTAFPMTGQSDRFLGGIAIFWESAV